MLSAFSEILLEKRGAQNFILELYFCNTHIIVTFHDIIPHQQLKPAVAAAAAAAAGARPALFNKQRLQQPNAIN
jgi:hypothetical protein